MTLCCQNADYGSVADISADRLLVETVGHDHAARRQP
jgi:hypothetical protein